MKDIYSLTSSLLTEGSPTSPELLRARGANFVMRAAAALPPLRQIAGPLWHEEELSVLFAPSGIGKSILAVQLCIQCAGGQRISSLPMEATSAPTLYCDFELSDRSFAQRYCSDEGIPYEFPKRLTRVDFQPDFVGEDAEGRLLTELESVIETTGARFVVVDNISAMRGTLESGQAAGSLFMRLKQMKQRHGVSMLIIAHTPKRDASVPLTVNDLAGSSQISNLSCSVFAMGRSTQATGRVYIKQVKTRNDELRHSEENVLVFDIVKSGYLHLEFVGSGAERDHLPKREDAKHEREAEVKGLLASGQTQRRVAELTGLSPAMVNRISKRLSVQPRTPTTPTIAPIDMDAFDDWQHRGCNS